MKKLVASAIVVGSLAAAGTAIAGLGASTGVNGSLHDMNTFSGGNADVMARVCVFCHTPHHAQVKDDQAGSSQYPLWNRKETAKTYTPYTWATPTNATVNGEDFKITDPLMGPSRLCMTCHDGSIALDEHGAPMAQTNGNLFVTKYSNRAELSGSTHNDVSDTHPIGFDYTKVKAWRNQRAQNQAYQTTDEQHITEIVDENSGFATGITVKNAQGTYNDVQRNTKRKIVDVLYQGKYMTCASCHEVHNKENVTQLSYDDTAVTGQTPDIPKLYKDAGINTPNYFLYAQEKASLICLSCHVK